MNILNKEIDFDFYDADDMERLEKGLEKVQVIKEDTNPDNMSASELLRKECEIIDDFFDEVFGNGIAKEIFGEKKNLVMRIKAFEEVGKEKIKAQQELTSVTERYQPINRENRRHNQFQKGRR